MAELRQVIRAHQEEGTEMWMAIPVKEATLRQKLLFIDWKSTPPKRIAELCGVKVDSVHHALAKLREEGHEIEIGKDTIGRPRGTLSFERTRVQEAYEDFVLDGGEDEW